MAKNEQTRSVEPPRKTSSPPVKNPSARRRFPRYILPKCPIAGLITGKNRYLGEIEQISQAGVFFLCKEPIQIDAVGKFGVELPTFFLRANVVVKMVRPGKGFGLKFIHMSSLDRQDLRIYLGSLRLTQKEGER